MQRMRYQNAQGAEIVFDFAAPYIFWKISGIELPPVDPIGTQASGQHGYTLHSILLSSRIVRLTGHVHGVSGIPAMYEARKRLNAVCNPLLGLGTLVYENDAGAWQISAFCAGNPYAEKIKEIQTLDVTFECPSPFWQNTVQDAVLLAYVEGGLEFPLVTPGEFGTLGYQALIDNDSDALTPLEFYIDGGSTNPVITNTTTGEFIKLSKNLLPSDKLYINTDPEHVEVSLITIDPYTNKEKRENAYGYLTFDSVPFQLVPGRNELIFRSDDENKQVRIRIYFHKRFVGV